MIGCAAGACDRSGATQGVARATTLPTVPGPPKWPLAPLAANWRISRTDSCHNLHPKLAAGRPGIVQYVHRNGYFSPGRIPRDIKRLLNNVERGQVHGQYTLAAHTKTISGMAAGGRAGTYSNSRMIISVARIVNRVGTRCFKINAIHGVSETINGALPVGPRSNAISARTQLMALAHRLVPGGPSRIALSADSRKLITLAPTSRIVKPASS